MAEELDQAFIEKLKAHDERIRHIDEGLSIEQELQNSPIWKLIFERAGHEATVAMEELIEVNPADHKAIVALQARIYRARAISRYLEEVVERGRRAQSEMIAENALEQIGDEDGG